jgi:hypothetical protein
MKRPHEVRCRTSHCGSPLSLRVRQFTTLRNRHLVPEWPSTADIEPTVSPAAIGRYRRRPRHGHPRAVGSEVVDPTYQALPSISPQTGGSRQPSLARCLPDSSDCSHDAQQCGRRRPQSSRAWSTMRRSKPRDWSHPRSSGRQRSFTRSWSTLPSSFPSGCGRVLPPLRPPRLQSPLRPNRRSSQAPRRPRTRSPRSGRDSGRRPAHRPRLEPGRGASPSRRKSRPAEPRSGRCVIVADARVGKLAPTYLGWSWGVRGLGRGSYSRP